ncbi:hypothetical protein GCM10027030_12630 [Luteococcus sediminum]|uniref:beta-ketoacyl [acyl carrier protein] synthase domain-containing protein n=1 Tax=Luteococcus sp. TaxID=1969402 RepID=UPI003734D4D7
MSGAETAADPAAVAMQRTLKVIQALKERIRVLEAPATADIVGLSWRLPGHDDSGLPLTSGRALWEFFAAGRDAFGPLPEERMGPFASVWNELPDRGAYLHDVFAFDPTAFECTPEQAVGMDPRHRQLLMVCREAMARAGLPQDGQNSEAAGLFVAGLEDDYQQWCPGDIDFAWASGNGSSIAMARLAYSLGISGPAYCVDAACASSLVALHTARLALTRHEIDVAVVAAVNIVLSPRAHIEHRIAGTLSEQGNTASYSASADGFVRGDACVALVLRREGESTEGVMGTILGAAVNNNGRATGLGAPNILVEANLIRAALADAAVSSKELSLIEGHGTGTQIGDAVEVETYTMALADRDQPVWLGSAKSNLGHAESAAGLVGVVKALLSMRHREVAPLAGFTHPNDMIDVDRCGVRFPARVEHLPSVKGLTALVTSFGAVGTNAAIVLREGAGLEAIDANVVGPWKLADYRP